MIPRELYGQAMAQQWGVDPNLPFIAPGLASNQLINNLRENAKINKTFPPRKKNRALTNYINNGAPSDPNVGYPQNNSVRGDSQRLN